MGVPAVVFAGSLVIAGVLTSGGCGDDGAASENTPPTPEAPIVPPETQIAPPTEAPEDPLLGLDETPSPSEYAGVPTGDVVTEAPPNGCVALTEAPQRIWPRPGVPAITVLGQHFYIALHSIQRVGGPDGEAPREDELHLVSASPTADPVPLRSLTVSPPHRSTRIAPPAIVADGDELVVAFIDGQGRVRLGATDPRRPSANLRTIEAGSGADLRFAPAVAVVGETRVVAWTDGTGTPMRVRVARANRSGVLLGVHDVTMAGMGAAAPVFAAGAATPSLYFVDPRDGISPIVRADLRADGTPRPSEVARPVGTVTVPPELAVAMTEDGRAFAAYTAIGNIAATAVGLMPLFGDVTTPLALVPGTGYGPLNVAAAAGPTAVVFASDAPKAQPPSAPREIHLRVVRSGPPGPPLILAGPDGTGRHAALARRHDGVLGVAFSTPDGVFVAWCRCDDSDESGTRG